jgi:LuxR family maltose regulon positive regulatory protein
LAPPGDDLVRAGAGALAGLASWAAGDIAGAHAAYTESVAGLRNVGFFADVLGCSITLGDLCLVQGRLGAARRTFEAGLDLGAGRLRGTADMHVGLAGVLLERDDLAGAAEHLAAAERLGEHKGLPQNPYRSRVVAARLREVEGDLDAALALLVEAERVYDGDYSPNVQPVPAVRARLHIRRGELDLAAAWAVEQRLDADGELSYLREYEHLTLARLLLAQHDERATPLLERLRDAAERGGRTGTLIAVLVLLALAHGDRAAASDALRRAVALARRRATSASSPTRAAGGDPPRRPRRGRVRAQAPRRSRPHRASAVGRARRTAVGPRAGRAAAAGVRPGRPRTSPGACPSR